MTEAELTLGLLPYGTVYMVDRDLSRDDKRNDLENIKSLNFNTVVLWPAVSRWDGTPPGNTAFTSVDETMDICQELGLKVILELQGQNTSNQEAPECFGLTENKTELNNPRYQDMTRKYLQEVAAHYKGHPALIAYDIYNEIGFNGKDPGTVSEFVEFLRVKYHDDIQALNTAWGMYFSDFASITRMTPVYNVQYDLWYSVVPQLDWLRFRPCNWAKRLDEWTAIIRDIDPDIVIFADVLGNDTMHNRAGDYYGATDWCVAGHVQVLGLSCWANMLGKDWQDSAISRWPQFWRASQSAARGKQTVISELMTSNRTMFPQEGSSLTDEIRLWSYQAIFHGLKGLIYWKYRPFRKGVQVGGRGLCNAAGEPTGHAMQAAEVAAFVSRHADALAGASPDHSGCALLHDHNAQDIYATIHTAEFYTDAHGGMFRGFWKQGISPAYIVPDDLRQGVPDWVRVLAVPCNVSLSQETAQSLGDFLKRGGTLLTESRFGLVDEDATLWPHAPGGGLHEIVNFKEKSFTCRFKDAISLGGATLAFADDYYQTCELGPGVSVLMRTSGGEPALISSTVGAGTHFHVPFIISHKLFQGAPGAEEVFAAIYGHLQSAVCPSVPVVAKEAQVDVSTLLDADGKPFLLGIINGESRRTTVRLKWIKAPQRLEGDPGATVEVRQDEMRITLSPRSAVAVFV